MNAFDQTALDRLLDADPGLAALRDHAAGVLGDDPGHDIHHAARVAIWTVRLGGQSVEQRLAVAAALLHDLVNVPKDHPDRSRASERSAEAARPLLRGAGFDAAAVDLACGAIRDHSFSRGAVPESDLGRALQDADRLDALGVLGTIRTVVTGVRMGGRPFDPDDPWARRRGLDDRRFTVDHFFVKLLRLPSTMRTEAGRREAERRAAWMESFLDQLAAEIAEPRPGQSSDGGASPEAASGTRSMDGAPQ